MADSDQTTERKLLVVDDDRMSLKYLSRLFQDHYAVQTADCAETALEKLKAGYVPHVILSDQMMPGLNGLEFLEEAHKIVPDTVKVILTAFVDVADLMSGLNGEIVFKFLAKPWHNSELVHTLDRCFEHYFLVAENKQLLEVTKAQNAELQKLTKQTHYNMVQTVKLMYGFINNHEGYYYTPHAQTVAVLARAIGVELGLPEERLLRLSVASLLHDIGKLGISEQIIVPSPDTLVGNERLKYEEHVKKAVKHLESVNGMEREAHIIAQHHELYDGSGFPHGLKADEIAIEALVLSLADKYHNLVYRIPAEQYFQAPDVFSHSLPKAEEAQKQFEAVQWILENKHKFSPLVVDAFMYVLENGTSPALIDLRKEREELISDGHMPEQASIPDADGFVAPSIARKKKGTRQMHEVSAQQIKIGWISAQPIYSATGSMLVPEGTIIDNRMLRGIKELDAMGLLPKSLRFIEETSGV